MTQGATTLLVPRYGGLGAALSAASAPALASLTPLSLGGPGNRAVGWTMIVATGAVFATTHFAEPLTHLPQGLLLAVVLMGLTFRALPWRRQHLANLTRA